MNSRCFQMLARELGIRAHYNPAFRRFPIARASSSAAGSSADATPEPAQPSFKKSAMAKATKKEEEKLAPVVPEPVAFQDSGMSVSDLKAALLDTLFATDRGLSASSEVRAEINELVTQLEAKNPTPSPTEDASLSGNWNLVYTSSPAVLGLLNFNRLPTVELGDIVQTIDMGLLTLENKVSLSGPLARSAFIATANLEVRSPKRLQLKLSKGTIQRPEIVESDLGSLPSSFTLMGTTIDLTQFNSLIKPLKDGVKEAAKQVGTIVANQPDLSVPVDNDQATTWLLITFLDESMRITRTDGGAVFVFCRVAMPVEEDVPAAAALPEVTIEES